MPSSVEPHITLVDGRSGAGKTRYASDLAAKAQATLISIDDVYPGWDGLDAGSWHIFHTVVLPISRGEPGRYRRWDWAAHTNGPWVTVEPDMPLVIEGCGAIRAESVPLVHATVWVDAPEHLRRERAVRRDGAMYEPQWVRWALQEERFLALHRSEHLAAEKVDGTE